MAKPETFSFHFLDAYIQIEPNVPARKGPLKIFGAKPEVGISVQYKAATPETVGPINAALIALQKNPEIAKYFTCHVKPDKLVLQAKSSHMDDSKTDLICDTLYEALKTETLHSYYLTPTPGTAPVKVDLYLKGIDLQRAAVPHIALKQSGDKEFNSNLIAALRSYVEAKYPGDMIVETKEGMLTAHWNRPTDHKAMFKDLQAALLEAQHKGIGSFDNVMKPEALDALWAEYGNEPVRPSIREPHLPPPPNPTSILKATGAMQKKDLLPPSITLSERIAFSKTLAHELGMRCVGNEDPTCPGTMLDVLSMLHKDLPEPMREMNLEALAGDLHKQIQLAGGYSGPQRP